MTSTDSGFESTTASWLCGDGGGCGSLVSVLIEKKSSFYLMFKQK